MSRVRIPQPELGASPLSVLSTPLPPTNTPTTAGTLAGILSGGLDAATRAVDFMGAVERQKAREAIISYRANQDAIRESERYAAQVAEAERRNESLMRGQAARDFDEQAIQIRAAFASGDMDSQIGRAVDTDVLTRMATEYADMRTVGMGADSAYTDEFRRQTIQLVGSLGVQRQAQLQEVDRQDNITSLQRRLSTVTAPEEVSAIRDETKAIVNLTDEQWSEQVLTPALQGRAAVGDTSVVGLANTFISDATKRAAISNAAAAENDRRKSVERMQILNDLSLEGRAAGTDIAKLTAVSNKALEYQKNNPELRATLDAMQDGFQSTINNITNSAIRAAVEQKEAEFKQSAAAGHMAALTAAVESGQGYAMLDGAEQTSTITYTKADGTTETKEVKYTATQADAERAMLSIIDQRARGIAGNDPVVYRRTRLNEVRKNAMVDPDLSRIASAGISKLSEYAAQEGAAFPAESIEGFSVYLDSLDIAPNAIRLGASEANIYAVAAQALDTPIVAGNPQDAETKARALSFAIRSIKRPDAGKLSEKMTAQFVSAARSVTAELLDGNLDEEGRVADVAQFIKDRASFYYVTGDPVRMTPEKAIDAAKQDAAKYGRKVNGHWTMTYTEMPVAGNGKPLDENMGLLAEAMARDYGVYNSVDESWWPGESKMGRADVKFTQLPSGRWVVTDSRNPYPTSITINRNGDRMPELSSAELVNRINSMVNDRIIRDNAGVVEAHTSTDPTLRAMMSAPAGALGDTYRLPFQTNQ